MTERSSDARDWLREEGFDLGVLTGESPQPSGLEGFVPDLDSYDLFLIALSGGKDSIALLLRLLELGVPREKIELHHHLVDGKEGSTLMDWPITESYCEAVAKAFEVSITFSWRRGGLEAEMLRQDAPTAPMMVPAEAGGHQPVGGNGPRGTRRKFPQVSADLSVRYCSSSAKIGPMDAYLRNHRRFLGKRTLVLTGERAEESRARAHYQQFEPHRADTRASKKVPRHIDTWRAVHAWPEQAVWDIMRRWRVTAHAAYFLGWGRCSCRPCVFSGADQWASVRSVAPAQFEQVANYEREFGVTIHRKLTVTELADRGSPPEFDPKWVELANSREWNIPIFSDPWLLPLGAMSKSSCGPT